MATRQAIQPDKPKDKRDELNSIIGTWEDRQRLAQILVWLPRVLAGTLAVVIFVGIVSRLTPLLTANQLLLLTIIALLIGVIVTIIVLRMIHRPRLQSAQHFDPRI